MSKEQEPKSLSERVKKNFWRIITVGVIAGISVAALGAAIGIL